MENYKKQIFFIRNLLKELSIRLEEYEKLVDELEKLEKEGYIKGNIYEKKIKGKVYLYYYTKIGDKVINRRLKDLRIKKAIENYCRMKEIKNRVDNYFLFFSKFIKDVELNENTLESLKKLVKETQNIGKQNNKN